MKTKKLIKAASMLFVLVATTLTACKKSETVAPVATPQLAKVTFWNPSTGAETNNTEFVYDANGTMTSVVYSGTTFTAAYNSANKLSTLTGVYKQGLTVTYSFEYNSANQLVKIVNTDGGTNANTKNISYNAAGKISKITIVYANSSITPYTADYTWNGDNLATASTGTYTTTYTAYDDKLNPFSLAEGIAVVFYGNPASKNNATELKTLNGSIVNVQKRAYEYHSNGYATSMKLLDGSGEGQKYYYK